MTKKFIFLHCFYHFNMTKMKKFILFFMLLTPMMLTAQVNIRITIDNQQDSVYYLYKYRGSKTAIVDTLACENGKMRIKSAESFPEGIYLLENESHLPLLEIMIGRDQRFSLRIKDLEDLNSIKVRGAKETKTYYKLMAKRRTCELNIAALESETAYYPENAKKADSLREELAAFENSLMTKDKNAFINVFISSLRQHGYEDYWLDFPLDDKRILTYPLIDNKLETYFNALPPFADAINEEIDRLIAQAGDCIEVRDYLIWYFYRKYYLPDRMNLDDIYIHLVNEYLIKLEMENVTESIKNKMAERASYLKNLKLGVMLPAVGDLYSIDNEYIVVYFYDKTCQKCIKESRVLEDIKSRHPEMTVFPVEINSTDKENLLLLYDIQTTPTIYVLDHQKKIIAKRIKVEDVERVLNMD